MPTGTFLTDAQRSEIVRLYNVHLLNCTEISSSVGVHRGTVYATLIKAGIDTSKKRRRKGVTKINGYVRNRPNQAEINQHIRDNYPEHGPGPTAEKFGITGKSVSKMAWNLGVKCTTGIARKNKTVADRNDSCDQSFFENWSPNLAWLLGYTWSDGAIRYEKSCNHVHYRCAISDEQIIHDIRDVIKSKSKLQRFGPKTIVGTKYIGQSQVGFSIDSINIARMLVEVYGIPSNKSNIDPPFPNIPDEWLNHFFRGAVDGDGSICPTATNSDRMALVLYGTRNYIESLRVRVPAMSGAKIPNLRQHGTSEKLFSIGWAAKEDVRKITAWMYPAGDYLFIKRKRDAANRHCESDGLITTDENVSSERL